MCNVKAEDAGEIHFVVRDVESTAYLEVEGRFPVSLEIFATGRPLPAPPNLKSFALVL